MGLHTCSAWHLNPEGDQDNRAIVDIANHYLRAIKRPVRYLNIPIRPSQTRPSDYTPFHNLELKPETVLSLGLINMADGLAGAQQRIAAAEKAGIFDFGVSFWCGMGNGHTSFSSNPIVRAPSADEVGDLLDLHKKVAAL